MSNLDEIRKDVSIMERDIEKMIYKFTQKHGALTLSISNDLAIHEYDDQSKKIIGNSVKISVEI